MSAAPAGISRRALWTAVALVLAGQAAAVYAVVRFTGAPAKGVQGKPAPVPVPVPVDKGVLARAEPWGPRPLDDAGIAFARELGRPPNDLRLFADERGKVSDAATRDLLSGRDAGLRLARDLRLPEEQAGSLVQDVLGYMIRRVSMRETFKGKPVTAGAIDDAVRNDALRAVERTFGAPGREAVAAALPGLPDLTSDAPPAG